MASFNQIILLGNLTRDPELRYTPNGTPVANFGLAVNRRYRQGDEWRDDVCFVDIVTFGRQAETVAEYLAKGSLAMIEGRLQWRSWETEDGQKRSKHEVVANNVQFMPRVQTDEPQRPAVSSYDATPEFSPNPIPLPPGDMNSSQTGMFHTDAPTGYGDDEPDNLPF